MKVDVDNFRNKVWGALILELLKLQELLIQNSLYKQQHDELFLIYTINFD